MDKQIIDRFKLFQKETGKYPDLNVELIEFDNLDYSDLTSFTYIKGQNKYIQRYIKDNPGNVAELGSSLNNDCIASHIIPESDSDVIYEECVSFNKDNAKGSRAFYRNYPFVMDRHHIAIVPNKEKIRTKYLQKSLDQFLILQNYGWGENIASVDEIKKYILPIPKLIDEKYNSLTLQDIILDFVNFYEDKNNNQITIISEALKDIKNIQDLLLPLFFEKDTSIQKRFNKFCKNHNFELKLEEIDFDIKRISSNNNNDLACAKRMGFTPSRDVSADIHWFTVRDLTANESIFIDEPLTKEKTSIKLIKESISENSSKFESIKRGDVLVSFKLTIGTVKIYNSTLPAYCNEAIDILTPNLNILSKFLAFNCMYEYPKYGIKTNNGITLNDEEKKLISIRIPVANTKFSSIQIQEIIVDFLDEYLEKLNSVKISLIELKSMFEDYNQILKNKTFN